jgi:hypothetical protein
MNMGLQNYAVFIPTENSYAKLNNKKKNTLKRYDTAQNYRILYTYSGLFFFQTEPQNFQTQPHSKAPEKQ